MRRTNRTTPAGITLLLATSMLLPAFLDAGASAQRPQPSPIPVTNTTPVGEPSVLSISSAFLDSSSASVRCPLFPSPLGRVKEPATFGECALAQRGRPNIPDPPRPKADQIEDPPGGVRKDIWNDENGRPIREDTFTPTGQRDTITIIRRRPDGSVVEKETFHFGIVEGGVRGLKKWEYEAYDKTSLRRYKETWEDERITEEGEIVPAKKTVTVPEHTTQDGKVIPGSETIFEWDSNRREWVARLSPAGRVIASTAPSGQLKSSAKPGHAVAAEVAAGLNTTLFSTPRGKIRVNLPDDMAAGDTLSGTVSTQPEGKDQNEQARNQGELSGYVVEMEQQQTSSIGRILKLSIPAAISTTHLILRDKNGEEIARREISVGRQPAPVEEFDLPTLGQQGRPIEVKGPFDGDFSTTNCKVGGEGLEMLAESPRKIVARNTSGQVGPSDLEVKERDQTARGEFRTLGLKLSAPKVNLLRGEQTTLVVVVSGLEGIKDIVPLDLENKSSSVIQMAGGEVQRINISPSQVQGGTYTTERRLTGVQRGAFTIIGTVISARQKPGRAITKGTGNTTQSCSAILPVEQCSVARPCNLGRDVDGDGKNDSCLAGERCAPAAEATTCAPGCLFQTIYYPKGAIYPLPKCECTCQ